jgi:hypothetical protein
MLGRDPARADSAAIARRRDEVLTELTGEAKPTTVTSFAVLGRDEDLAYEGSEAAKIWTGGSVDVLSYPSIDGLLGAYETVLRAERHRAPRPTWSVQAFATRAFSVRPHGHEARLRHFSIGGAIANTTRAAWHQVWHAHGDKIAGAPTFETYLKGYTQYHLLDEPATREVGPPDTHGISHTGWASVAEMNLAMSLPDYVAVIRTDENNLISKQHVVRVLATPTS